MTLAEESKRNFEAVYAAHVRQVLAYCLRRTGQSEAHDATAEVFVVAWRRVTELPAPPEVLPWLYGVAANVLRNQTRSTRRLRNLVGKIGAQPERVQYGPETHMARRAEHAEVHRAIDALKPIYREVIKLVEWEELSRDQVAEMLGVSRAAVDQRVHRAFQQLERTLKHLAVDRSPPKGGADDAAAS